MYISRVSWSGGEGWLCIEEALKHLFYSSGEMGFRLLCRVCVWGGGWGALFPAC